MIKALEKNDELIEPVNIYNIKRALKNGLKVVLEDEEKPEFGMISGMKSFSLGIPIGINSAGAEDLRRSRA